MLTIFNYLIIINRVKETDTENTLCLLVFYLCTYKINIYEVNKIYIQIVVLNNNILYIILQLYKTSLKIIIIIHLIGVGTYHFPQYK